MLSSWMRSRSKSRTIAAAMTAYCGPGGRKTRAGGRPPYSKLQSGGRISDMVNLTRANDAIASYIETLDRKRRGRRRLSEGVYSDLKPREVA